MSALVIGVGAGLIATIVSFAAMAAACGLLEARLGKALSKREDDAAIRVAAAISVGVGLIVGGLVASAVP